jgi:hypothetical protein
MQNQRWFTIHPKRPSFYNLEGKDNIVLFFTDRYVDQPLLIKGLVPGLRLPLEFFADVIQLETYKLVVISKGKNFEL